MSTQPENPPAFPLFFGGDQPTKGMTLRDYLAAHAPIAEMQGESWLDHAQERYEYADAMLSARTQKPEGGE